MPAQRRDTPTAVDDAIALLRTEHEQAEQLFEAYARMVTQAASGVARRRLAELICTTLIVLDALERELFYPAAREALAYPAPLDCALGDHQMIRRLVEQVQAARPAEPDYDQRIAHLARHVQGHLRFEEDVLFAALRRARVDLGRLGAVLQRRREQLLSGAASSGC